MGFSVLVLLLAACAGTSEQPEQSDEARRAAEINTSLGREYMSRGQNEVALEKLKKAIAADPDYAPGHTMIAVLYEQIGELELAGTHYEKAVKASPRNGDVNNNYGVFLCSEGRYSESERYFLHAVDDPFYSTPEVAYANAGSCFLQAGDLGKAERYLRQSLEYDREFPDALLSMSGLEFRNADYLGARAFLQRFEASGRETAESLLLGMRIETRLGDTASAEAYRGRLMNRYPDSNEARRLKSGMNNG
jgi:type IV pilus assembly protein PilF